MEPPNPLYKLNWDFLKIYSLQEHPHTGLDNYLTQISKIMDLEGTHAYPRVKKLLNEFYTDWKHCLFKEEINNSDCDRGYHFFHYLGKITDNVEKAYNLFTLSRFFLLLKDKEVSMIDADTIFVFLQRCRSLDELSELHSEYVYLIDEVTGVHSYIPYAVNAIELARCQKLIHKLYPYHKEPKYYNHIYQAALEYLRQALIDRDNESEIFLLKAEIGLENDKLFYDLREEEIVFLELIGNQITLNNLSSNSSSSRIESYVIKKIYKEISLKIKNASLTNAFESSFFQNLLKLNNDACKSLRNNSYDRSLKLMLSIQKFQLEHALNILQKEQFIEEMRFLFLEEALNEFQREELYQVFVAIAHFISDTETIIQLLKLRIRGVSDQFFTETIHNILINYRLELLKVVNDVKRNKLLEENFLFSNINFSEFNSNSTPIISDYFKFLSQHLHGIKSFTAAAASIIFRSNADAVYKNYPNFLNYFCSDNVFKTLERPDLVETIISQFDAIATEVITPELLIPALQVAIFWGSSKLYYESRFSQKLQKVLKENFQFIIDHSSELYPKLFPSEQRAFISLSLRFFTVLLHNQSLENPEKTLRQFEDYLDFLSKNQSHLFKSEWNYARAACAIVMKKNDEAIDLNLEANSFVTDNQFLKHKIKVQHATILSSDLTPTFFDSVIRGNVSAACRYAVDHMDEDHELALFLITAADCNIKINRLKEAENLISDAYRIISYHAYCPNTIFDRLSELQAKLFFA